jgi:predicted kinase
MTRKVAMIHDAPTLHMVCGKIAAGKTTLCQRLATPGRIVIAQDHWMSKLFRDELLSVEDYIRLVPRLHQAMGPHVVDLLHAGLSVVLDWPANTIASRAWMRGIFTAAGAAHRLHVLDVPDDICRTRLRARNEAARHEFVVTMADFDALGRYFEPPTPAEGFDIVMHPAA